MQKRIQSFSIVISIVLLICFAGCQNQTLQEIPPGELVSRSAARMEDVSAFEFEILREGAPAYLDSGETLVLRKMTGAFVSPESAEAKVKVILVSTGVSVSIDVVSIGEVQYETLPLTDTWHELPPGNGFNPVELFDIEIGLKHILENDILELILEEHAEIESLPGKNLFHLTGTLDASNLSAMTYGLIDPDELAFKIWIDPDTFDLHQMVMIEHSGTENERIWIINFWNFNIEYTIKAPLP